MFEEIIGEDYDGEKKIEMIIPIDSTRLTVPEDPNQAWMRQYREDPFFRSLVNMRARRSGGFINDRGFRHICNRGDKTGVTYAFWLTRTDK